MVIDVEYSHHKRIPLHFPTSLVMPLNLIYFNGPNTIHPARKSYATHHFQFRSVLSAANLGTLCHCPSTLAPSYCTPFLYKSSS